MDFASGLASASQAMALAKALRNIDRNLDAATYRATIAELMEAATDAKIALVEAKESLAGKDAEILRLKDAFVQKAKLGAGPGGYLYEVNDDDAMVGFPFCPRCDQIDGRMVRLVQNKDIQDAKCPVCSNEYTPVTAFGVPTAGEPNTLYERQLKRRSEGYDRILRRHTGIA